MEPVTDIFVTNTDDCSPGQNPLRGSLRYAINKASGVDAEVTIRVMLPPGSEIKLKASLVINAGNLVIEGNGIILSQSAESLGGTNPKRLMTIEKNAEDETRVTIRRVHFKGSDGGAIQNSETLNLESCIFSNNTAGVINRSGSGGAIYNQGDLYLKGCTFYKNEAGFQGGAICNDKKMELTGNLFYGNSASFGPVIGTKSSSQNTNSKGYNVVDYPFVGDPSPGQDNCGWEKGLEDIFLEVLSFSPKTFRLFPDLSLVTIPPNVLADYPEQDFYGAPIGPKAAAGAVQATMATTGFYLDLEYDPIQGTVSYDPTGPDDDGIISGSGTTLTIVAPPPGYKFSCWQYGTQGYSEKTTLTLNVNSNYIAVRAVFKPYVTSTSDDDTPGTLRYALNNAKDGDTIRFSDEIFGKEIKLNSPLEINDKSITIEGVGLTLTPSNTWSNQESLLNIRTDNKDVVIQRVHFKKGHAAKGGAIYSQDTNLTIESCIFSENSASNSGGAIYSFNMNYEYGYDFAVKGCTFYSNKARNEGGAIYYFNPIIWRDLTLTGNLFYDNSADNGWPILKIESSVSAPSFSYNAVNVPFGTEDNQSGWTGGQNDTTFERLGIPSDPINTTTFEPLFNQLNFITVSEVANFPLTDFYGNDRFPSTSTSSGSAPGAVK